MKKYNFIYGVLCKGKSTHREVDKGITITDNYIIDLIDALIPPSCTQNQRELLAELYIRFIQTDASLVKKLKKIDPYNSYQLTEFEIIEPTFNIKLEDIANNIKNLHITDIRYNDVLGYIMDGIECLLLKCEGLND